MSTNIDSFNLFVAAWLVLAAWAAMDMIKFIIVKYHHPILATTVNFKILFIAAWFFFDVIAYIKTKHPHPARAAFALIGPTTLAVIGLFPVETERYSFVDGLCFACTMTHYSLK